MSNIILEPQPLVHTQSLQSLQYIMKTKKKPYTCKCCGKEYKSESNMKKHGLLCEIIYQTKMAAASNSTNKEEAILPSPLPNNRQLCLIIQELIIKQQKMEDKIEQMQKWVDMKKKKLNIIEWLNNNQKPSILFKQITEEIGVIDSDIDFIYKPDNTMVDLIHILLERNIYENIPSPPLFAFIQKPNTIYYYDIDPDQIQGPDQNQNTWTELSKEKITQLMNKIHSKILNVLMEWKQKHHDFIHSSDKNEVLYCKMMGKFMNIDFKENSVIHKIKSAIYNKIKKDIKNMMEYELEF